ncbi:ABC transporter ATP-binding protein [Lichenihabitans sp. Uapishka_5]|uniref:ABC transporter ATP-binding protein n=1 Tax=Lichenihabitans sp. Uapishka_5 TaxID=3037302 RepID=UPI0029E7FC6C|nr:ABC transporter ATP-binding protein [Lichenihabitans sp. Uapishka_5]MDX7950631.1 ABC transporter ATP-binding protein [Lichenihabitans sp. Uapishka_5]
MSGTSDARPLLAAEAVVAGYEPGLPIVHGASLAVAAGEILAVLGPNGAGKSTLVKALAGLVPVSRGTVRLDGRDITGLPAHLRPRAGLAFVPQTENIFASLSVADNLRIACDVMPDRPRGRARTAELLDLFPDLARARTLLAGRLSGGQRQMLAVARALVASPRVLMLDEPSAGLSPLFVSDVFARLRTIRDTGVAIVLVEQNVRAALKVADRALVLVEGRNRHEGPAKTLADDPAIAALYLGGAPHSSGSPA